MPTGTPKNREHDVRSSSGSKLEGSDGRQAREHTAPARRNSRLSAASKAKRDQLIVADRLAGFTWSMISARRGPTPRQCQKIFKEAVKYTEEPWEQPNEVVDETLRRIDAAVGDLALLAETTSNDSVRLGAIRSRLDALTRQLDMLVKVGLLPARGDYFQLQRELFTFMDEVEVLLKRSGLGEKDSEELSESIRDLLWVFGDKHPVSWTALTLRRHVALRELKSRFGVPEPVIELLAKF